MLMLINVSKLTQQNESLREANFLRKEINAREQVIRRERMESTQETQFVETTRTNRIFNK